MTILTDITMTTICQMFEPFPEASPRACLSSSTGDVYIAMELQCDIYLDTL